MSLHRSLKTGGKLSRFRSVMTRHERLVALEEVGRVSPEDSPFGLPKTKVQKVKAGKKKKKKKKEEEAGAATATTPAAATPAAKPTGKAGKPGK